jgi:hypothetical protein
VFGVWISNGPASGFLLCGYGGWYASGIRVGIRGGGKLGPVGIVGGMIWKIWVLRLWMFGPAVVCYVGSVEWNYGRVSKQDNGWRWISWVRIPELIEGKIRIDGSSMGRNGSCGVMGLWPRGSWLEINGNAIACRVWKRLSSLASFLSSVAKESCVAREPGFRRSFAWDRSEIHREALGVVNCSGLGCADAFHDGRFVYTDPVAHEL